MLIGWGSYGIKPARGESCPSAQRRGLAAPGREKLPFTGQKSFHIPTTHTREENAFRSKAPRRVSSPQPHWVIADWLGLMEPARGDKCPSGQRRDSAASGQDKFPSTAQKSFHIPTTPTREENAFRSKEPRRVRNSQPHWVIVDWLGLMEPARGESCPSGQRRGPATPGEDGFPSPD